LWAGYLTPVRALAPVLLSVMIWAFAAWGFFPAQQSRLIGIAGVQVASTILSLNASFMSPGFALGATVGSITLSIGGISDLGAVAAVCVLSALALFALGNKSLELPAPVDSLCP
jgi:predicted MFS family arabinose efflux permease